MADSSGTTLMDLITSDPAASKQGGASAAGNKAPSPSRAPSQPTALGKPATDRKSKKATLLQIQNDTISAAKAVRTNIMPHRTKKKPVSYAQLARSIHELAATSDQKKSQKQLINHVFPKLAVYNSVDPSLAPSLLMLHQQCEDRTILRYVVLLLGLEYYQIQKPKLADAEYHARRLQALKALTYAPSSNSEILSNLYEIVFSILEQVGDAQKRKKGLFGTKGGDKESIIRSNLQYAAISALRRLPLDPGNPAFLHRAVQGITFPDPVAVRHSLGIISELATKDPYSVAMSLGKHVLPGGALQDVLHLHDVLARVSLTRLCYTLSRARALDDRPDIKSQFSSVLFQLLLDPSERVCFEAISCVLGKFDNVERPEERAAGWYRLCREILKLPDAPSVSSKESNVDAKDALPKKPTKDKSKAKRPQPLIKLVMRRLESSFRSFSRPVLHAAARVVQEMGKSRAAAFALGVQDIDEGVDLNAVADDVADHDSNENPFSEGKQ
ncbi:unnamed protein product [Rhodiola kirilowii]